MLTWLAISNLAIIDRLEMELFPGLTVVTGETGAGKSMLLSALTMLLGGTVSRDVLRTGADSLAIEGAWVDAGSLPFGPLFDGEPVPDEVHVRRTTGFSEASKRDRLLVAGRLVTRSALQEIAPDLVNISSQHEYIRLLKKSEQVHLLDRFGAHGELLERMAADFERHAALFREVERIREAGTRRDARIAQLADLVRELDEAEVREGEEGGLMERIPRLAHAVDIAAALGQSIEALYEGEHDTLSSLGGVERLLAGIIRYDSRIAPLVDRIASARLDLEDVAASLRGLLASAEVEPELLDLLQERLALIQKLRRKHGAESDAGLVDLLERSRRELADLEDTGLSLARLEKERDQACRAMQRTAQELNHARINAAQRMQAAVREVLALLDMPKADFVTAFTLDESRIGPLGGDDVEFLFSANPGENPRSLRKIASGGELSRVLLAFKAVLAEAYPVPTYVFDEIDSGVGGKTALAVGRLLAELASRHQVVCITHTAQLAAFADHHYVVTKEEREGKTHARIRLLDDHDERVQEIARMLSGLEDSDTALAHAAEMIEAARKDRGRRV